jgi:hypothetical protein
MSFIRVGLATIMILNAGMNVPAQKYGTDSSSPRTVVSLKRGKAVEGAIIGRLYINDQFECYTLEDEDTRIPVGTYSLKRHYSTKFKRTVFLLKDVPGRSSIEIHPGNFKADSQGCILVGISHTDRSVVGSGTAMTKLVKHLQEPSLLIVS